MGCFTQPVNLGVTELFYYKPVISIFIKTTIMKKLLILLIIFQIIFTCSYSQQHQLIKKWETDSTLKVPESVLFDAGNNVLYVTNIDGTDPWAADGKGSVGKVGLD